MLQAALAAPDTAVAAWRAWRAGHVVYDADEEESRLLATIASRIGQLVTDDAELQRLHGHRRHAWTVNMLRAAQTNDVASSLRAAGMDSLFFKGLGMLPLYGDMSMRNMSDADLLVRWHQRHDVIDHLASIGFSPVHGVSLAKMHTLDRIYPGFGMRRPDGIETDVHWRPLHHLRHRPHLDEILFEYSRLERIGATTVAVADPSHHLVLVIGHGMRSDSGAHLIAVADACQLLVAPDFDARRAAALAHEYERTSAVDDVCAVIIDILADGAHSDLVNARDRAIEMRQRLRRRTVGDILLDRQLTSAHGSSSGRLKTARSMWVAASDPRWRDGGPVFGLIDLARRELSLDRARDVPAQLVWILGGRSEPLGSFRRTVGGAGEDVPTLPIGDSVSVSTTTGFELLLASGWWEPEEHHVWSKAPEAALTLNIDLPPNRGCNLMMRTVPFVNATHPDLTVDVRINGTSRAVWRYRYETDVEVDQRITLHADDLDDGRCEVLFIIHGASSPLESGVAADERVLGIALQSIAIEPIGILDPGGHVSPRHEIGDETECGDAAEGTTRDGLRAGRVRRDPRTVLGRRHRSDRRAAPPPVR